MEWFGLLLAHLLGDYILQNDWMAKNKVNPHPGESDHIIFPSDEWFGWWSRDIEWREGHLACTVHCFLYTLAVYLLSFWWLPWWAYVIVFVTHWPIDRFRLARWWMVNVSKQREFATGPLAPWSIIIVDNIFHLLTLYVIGVVCLPA